MKATEYILTKCLAGCYCKKSVTGLSVTICMFSSSKQSRQQKSAADLLLLTGPDALLWRTVTMPAALHWHLSQHMKSGCVAEQLAAC